MAIFSDVDIRQELGKTISIEGFDPRLLSPDSYDIAVGQVYEIIDDTIKGDLVQIHKNLGSDGLNTDYKFPELRGNQVREKRTRRISPGKVYFAECTTKIEADGIKVRIVPKSGRARDGMYAFNPNLDGRVVIIPYAHSTLPEGPIAQAIFYEDPTPPIKFREMIELQKNGKLSFSDPRIHADDRGRGCVTRRFSKELPPYNGGNLTDDDSSNRFSDSRNRSVFNFCLCITEESFGTGDSHILWMYSAHGGHIYPNAPLCHTNTQQQRHTLEVSLTEDQVKKILDEKNPYACSVMAYALRTPTSTQYCGNYVNQDRPRPKISG